MSTPRQPDERLSDWVDGCMSDRDRDRFEAEMRVNARLQQEAEAFRRTVTTVQSALRQDPARVDIADRVIAALQQPAATASRSVRSLRGMTWLLGLSAAAALLLTAVLLQQWQPAVSPPAQRPVARLDQPAPTTTLLDDLDGRAEHEDVDSKASGDNAVGGAGREADQRAPSAPGRLKAEAEERKAAAAPTPAPQEPAPATGLELNLPQAQASVEKPAKAAGDEAGAKIEAGAVEQSVGAVTVPKTVAPRMEAGRGSAKDKSNEPKAGRDGDAGTAPGDLLALRTDAEPVVQTLVVTRQLAAPSAAAAGERELAKKSAASAASAEAVTGTGADDFFLGSVSGPAAASPTQTSSWLAGFVQPDAPRVQGFGVDTGLSVQTFDVLGLVEQQRFARRERSDEEEKSAKETGEAKQAGGNAAPSNRRELLDRLAPPQARATRLAVVEGDSDEVRKLIGEVRKLAEHDQLDFYLQELPVSVLTELQQRAAAQPEQKLDAGPGLQMRAFGPPAPAPRQGEAAAPPPRMRIAILFRELPPPEKH